jgi:hypothetical protein
VSIKSPSAPAWQIKKAERSGAFAILSEIFYAIGLIFFLMALLHHKVLIPPEQYLTCS